MKRILLCVSLSMACVLSPLSHAIPLSAINAQAKSTPKTESLTIGETHVLRSSIMDEQRRLNVYLPESYKQDKSAKYPVIYMLDGGVQEDFLHIVGLMQVSIANGTMRPFILVGIENTVRRRDLTGPSQNALDKQAIPNLGGSAKFREFLLKEAIPFVEQRYRVTSERALLGESLAGLFTIETMFQTPDAFQTYVAIDPSLWWNDQKLTAAFAEKLKANPALAKQLYFASSGQRGMEEVIQAFATMLEQNKPQGLQWTYEKFPAETHATIYHPAAIKAFRRVFAPQAAK